MQKILSGSVLAAVVAGGLLALAHTGAGAAESHKMAAKPITVKGEIVELGCYVGHGAHGEKHKDCATKCIAGGAPIGVLTPAGKLYLLTPNHDNGDAFAKAKEMPAQMAEVTGTPAQRNGMMAIDVTDVKPAPVAAK